MPHLPLRFTATMTAVLTLTACSASFSIGQQSAQTDDCVGKDGKCSVAEHEARQPVVAGDLDLAPDAMHSAIREKGVWILG